MPKLLMEVLPYDGLLRRLVTSQRIEGESYLVDLVENRGCGRCSCLGFAVEFQPLIDKLPASFREWDDRLRCKHIKLVRAAIGYELLNKLVELKVNEEIEAKKHVWKAKKESPVDPGLPAEIERDGYGIPIQAKETDQAAQQGDGETDEGLPEAKTGIPD